MLLCMSAPASPGAESLMYPSGAHLNLRFKAENSYGTRGGRLLLLTFLFINFSSYYFSSCFYFPYFFVFFLSFAGAAFCAPVYPPVCASFARKYPHANPFLNAPTRMRRAPCPI